jgi:hypothetical protein
VRTKKKSEKLNDISCNADERLSTRVKFLTKSFIPIMNALDISAKKGAIMYDSVARAFIF